MKQLAPLTLWLTGLSGAGKSTLATALVYSMTLEGKAATVLDGDSLRSGLCRGLGFSEEDRRENVRRVAEVARLMNDAGLLVVCALISPLRSDRALARAIIGDERFIEIYVATPLDACEARDPKGLYKRARLGQIEQFTGVSAAYEAPAAPDLQLNTSQLSVQVCVDRIISMLCERKP